MDMQSSVQVSRTKPSSTTPSHTHSACSSASCQSLSAKVSPFKRARESLLCVCFCCWTTKSWVVGANLMASKRKASARQTGARVNVERVTMCKCECLSLCVSVYVCGVDKEEAIKWLLRARKLLQHARSRCGRCLSWHSLAAAGRAQ